MIKQKPKVWLSSADRNMMFAQNTIIWVYRLLLDSNNSKNYVKTIQLKIIATATKNQFLELSRRAYIIYKALRYSNIFFVGWIYKARS